MLSLKAIAICLLGLASHAKAEAPWSWLSGELRGLETRRLEIDRRLALLPGFPVPQAHERAGFTCFFPSSADSLRWVQVDLGSELPLDEVIIIPTVPGGAQTYGFPHRFRVDAANDAEFAEPVTLLDHTQEDSSAMVAP